MKSLTITEVLIATGGSKTSPVTNGCCTYVADWHIRKDLRREKLRAVSAVSEWPAVTQMPMTLTLVPCIYIIE